MSLKFKEHKGIIILTGIFLLARIPFLLKFHNIIWDESVYLAMGKFLYSQGAIGLWEPQRPILLPLFLGFIWKLGLNVFFAEILMYLFATGSMILVYNIGRKLFSKNIGLVAAALLGATPTFFLYSPYLLTEIGSTFLALAAFYFFLERKFILTGIFSALAFLFRFPHGLILIVFLAAAGFEYAIYKKRSLLKDALKISAAFLIATVPYFLFNYFMYRSDTCCLSHALFRPLLLASYHQINPATSVITGTLYSYFFNIFFYLQIFKENLLLLFIVPALAIFFRNRWYKKSGFNALFIAVVLYLGYHTVIINKQLRFAIMFLPFLALWGAYGLGKSFSWLKEKTALKTAFILALAAVSIFIFYQDLGLYNWRTAQPGSIVTEYYQYFADKNIKGPILTADPVPAAYADALFIPFYFSLEAGKAIYEENKENAFAIIDSSHTFFCQEEDIACKEEVRKFSQRVREENKLAFSRAYGDRSYFIYQRE